MSHDPKEIPTFINLLDEHEFVIGSRYSKGGKCEMPLLRLFLSIIGNKIIKFVLKLIAGNLLLHIEVSIY